MVSLGPFSRIVNVNWASGPPTLTFSATWWGTPPEVIPCYEGSGLLDWMYYTVGPVYHPGDPYVTLYSPGFWSTLRRLKARPNYAHINQYDGVTDVMGAGVGDNGFTYTGLPSIEEDFATGTLEAVCLNIDSWYETYMFEDNRTHRIYIADSALSADFALRAPNRLYSQFCEYSYPIGSIWQPMDARGMGVGPSGFPDHDYPSWKDIYSFEVCRKTLDFSGLVVTRTSDGRQWRAVSLMGPDPESSDQTTIVVNLERIP